MAAQKRRIEIKDPFASSGIDALIRNTQEETKTQEVYDAQQVRVVRNTQYVQEVPNVQQVHDTYHAHKTQGKAGQKLPRINLALSPENLSYLQAISRMSGKSITAYINALVDVDRANKGDVVDQVNKIFEGVK